ncbi:hypothetical protein [Halopiger goleimassiliensis]|uniref:hypothetical protein n=1 Tax=Halopiger goleimassiliensis TaxID=1293048 RepID=UPI00067822B4|nr:hypothetical protein [Halopiger goleimassiliensis]
MRLSPAVLLVAIAFIVPVVVELRTVLAWFGVEVTVLESLALGAALSLGLVLYAVWPESEPHGSG